MANQSLLLQTPADSFNCGVNGVWEKYGKSSDQIQNTTEYLYFSRARETQIKDYFEFNQPVMGPGNW
jgi:hypothetical protein